MVLHRLAATQFKDRKKEFKGEKESPRIASSKPRQFHNDIQSSLMGLSFNFQSCDHSELLLLKSKITECIGLFPLRCSITKEDRSESQRNANLR